MSASEQLRGVLAKAVAALAILFLVGPFASVEHLEQMAHEFGDSALSRLYEASHANKITVVVVDDTSLEKLKHQTWPMPWSLWEGRLSLVECLRPTAIFFDVLFPPRADIVKAVDGVDARNARGPCPAPLGEARPDIPIYFATVGGGTEWARFTSRERRLAIEWDGSLLAYPKLSTTTGESRPTAAFGLAQAICAGAAAAPGLPGHPCADVLAQETAAASIVPRWPGRIPQHQEEWVDSISACRDALPEWWEIALALLVPPLHWPSQEPLACRPFLTVNFYDLQEGNLDASFKRAFEGRVVLFGQSIQGMRDFVPAPLHRQLPGVYLHAAVLENLMSMGYRFDHIEKWPAIIFVTLSVLVFYASTSLLARPFGRAVWRRWLGSTLGAVATYTALIVGMRFFLHWPPGMIPEAAFMILTAMYFGKLSHDGHLHDFFSWLLGARLGSGKTG